MNDFTRVDWNAAAEFKVDFHDEISENSFLFPIIRARCIIFVNIRLKNVIKLVKN